MQTFHTLDLAVQFEHLVRKQRVSPYLQDQLRRASASIALNLAEGNAKFSRRDKARFYEIALGSLRECQTLFRLEHLEAPELHQIADRIGGSLYCLVRSFRKK